MSNYQITLTPVDKFFFGGDMTFQVGKDDKDKFNEKYSSYIIKSSMMPQQTSLLGMLRFLILRNAGEDVFKNGEIVNKTSAKKLIGSKSFTVNESHEENQFGKIKGLSHIKVRSIVSGKSVDLEFAPMMEVLSFDKASDGFYNMKDICIPIIPKEKYDPKSGLETMMTDGTHNYELNGDDGIFKADQRVGNDRDIKTGLTDDDALFKQISYRFSKPNYCFAFEAEVDDCVPLDNYSGQLVSVGGDNSQFVIHITKKTNEGNTKEIPLTVYLLSPTYLTRDDVKNVKFAVTKLIPFRFLLSEMDQAKSYHILHDKLKRSDRYELYAPGSIFYFDNDNDKQDFISCIEAKKEFRQIGYNEYK